MSDEILTLAAEPRTVTGKKVKVLRRNHIIPCVVYGQHESLNIQIEQSHLRRVLRVASTTQLVEIEMEGTKRTVLAREIQQHLTRGDLIHVDFYEVDMKVLITALASLVLVGEPGPETEGLGSVVLTQQTVEIECLPGDLISELEVDMSRIETPDDLIYISDLTVPEGVTLLVDVEGVIARFQYTQTEEAAEAEEMESVSVEDVETTSQDLEEEEEIEE